MLTPDSIVPNPASPQSFNRYSYVFNSPLRFVDPSGHFTEQAVEEYLQNNFDDWESILNAWKANEDWWRMLMGAQAGDTLLTDYWGGWSRGYGNAGSSWTEIGGSLEFTFSGKDNTRLDGIQMTSPSEWFSGRPNINLQNIFQGQFAHGQGNYMDAYEMVWDSISINVIWGALLSDGVIPRYNGRSVINESHSMRIEKNHAASSFIGIVFEETADFFVPGGGLVVDVSMATVSTIKEQDWLADNTVDFDNYYYLEVPGGTFLMHAYTYVGPYDVPSSMVFQDKRIR